MSRDIPGRCICCGTILRIDPHHPHPQSQGGTDKGTVDACRGCHSLYDAICGQQLAKTVKARVQNFLKWMSKFPPTGLLGQGLHPADMAPGFVIDEAGEFIFSGNYEDMSEGSLSTLGKIKKYVPRFPGKGRQ